MNSHTVWKTVWILILLISEKKMIFFHALLYKVLNLITLLGVWEYHARLVDLVLPHFKQVRNFTLLVLGQV